MALTQISTSGIKDATIATADVANDAITSALIADNAVIQAAIAGNSVNEERIEISNAGTNGQYLQKQTGNTGGLTWADPTIVLADEDSDTTCFPIFATDATGTVAGGRTNADKLTFNASTGLLESTKFSTLGTSGEITVYGAATGGGSTTAVILNNKGVTLSETTTGPSELRFLGTSIGDWIAFRSDGSFSGTTTFILPDGDGSAGQVMKTDGSGNLDWTTIDVSTFTSDITFDNATNAGKDILWDMSDNALEFLDDVKAVFGTGNDLQIWHDGTDTHIDNNTSNLRINSNDIQLRDSSENFYIDCNNGASVDLYHNGTKKIETTSGGVQATGQLNFAAAADPNISIRDTGTIAFGNEDDLKIYHNGTSSYISNSTSGGNFAIETDGYIWIGSKTDSETYIKGIKDGAVELYYNNFKTFRTHENGITLYGPEGGDGHLIMYADEGDDNADFWRLTAGADGDWVLYNYADGAYEKSISATGGGTVKLYHDNHIKFETTTTGTTTTGKFYCEADEANGWVGQFWHQGNASDRYGVLIYCGSDDASGTNYAMFISDGDGSTQGQISFTGGTVSYGAFTAHHPCVIPNSDNPSDDSMAYPYGTLLETVSIGYSQKNGANTERGIRYNVQKTQTANSKKVLGAYSSSMNGGPDNETNLHEVSVLGDGHILCNNSGGNISVGDGICSSSTAGIGQKATASPSMIIGIAQDDVTFTGTETKLVPVQYGLQQFTPW